MKSNQAFASHQLRSIVERIEKMNDEKAAIAADIRDIYAEANGNGFDTKAIRQIVKLRAMDSAAREEMEALLDTYKSALGMLSDTPLGVAAIASASRHNA